MEITDLLNINGWGVAAGTYSSLLSLPPIKTMTYVDWPEETSVEFDTTAPRLQNKTFTINYISILSNIGETPELETVFREKQYWEEVQVSKALFFQDYAKDETSGKVSYAPLALTLRVAGITKTITNSVCNLAISFSMDDPWQAQGTCTPDELTSKNTTRWTIDGVDMGQYGFYPLSGTLAAFCTDGTVKNALEWESTTEHGLRVDTSTVQPRGKTSHAMTFLFNQPTEKAWTMLRTFLSSMTKSGLRQITAPNGLIRNCVYSSCECITAHVNQSQTWAKFTLTIID